MLGESNSGGSQGGYVDQHLMETMMRNMRRMIRAELEPIRERLDRIEDAQRATTRRTLRGARKEPTPQRRDDVEKNKEENKLCWERVLAAGSELQKQKENEKEKEKEHERNDVTKAREETIVEGKVRDGEEKIYLKTKSGDKRAYTKGQSMIFLVYEEDIVLPKPILPMDACLHDLPDIVVKKDLGESPPYRQTKQSIELDTRGALPVTALQMIKESSIAIFDLGALLLFDVKEYPLLQKRHSKTIPHGEGAFLSPKHDDLRANHVQGGGTDESIIVLNTYKEDELYHLNPGADLRTNPFQEGENDEDISSKEPTSEEPKPGHRWTFLGHMFSPPFLCFIYGYVLFWA